MKKARAIICGVLAALMLAGCGGSGIGKYAVAEAGTPAWTRKTEDRVDTETLRQFSDETAAVVFTGEGNAVYSPLSLYAALGMLTELTDGQTKQQMMDLLSVSDSEELRQWTQTLWRQLYRDGKDSALWLGNAVFLNENMTFHKEPLDVLAKSYYASSYQVSMGSKAADEAIAAWLNEQTNDLLTEDTGAIKTKERDLLRLYNTIYYKAGWQDTFESSRTETDTFTAADGSKQQVDFMHRTDEGTYRKGEGYTAAPRRLKYGRMVFVLPEEGVTPESLLARDGFLTELTGEYSSARAVWSVPRFDVKSSVDLKDILKALGVTDAFDADAADFTPLTDSGAVVSGVMQAARVKIDEDGVEAAAYTEIVADTTAAEEPPPVVEMNLNRPFLFVILNDANVPLFVGTVQTIEG